MTLGAKPRVAVVTSHPIQYHSPWFRGLSSVFDLHVFYAHKPDGEGQARAGYGVAFEWDVDLLSGYPHTFLDNVARTPNVFHFAGCDTPEIDRLIAAGRFDAVIVTGWYLKSYWQAIRAAKRSRVPVLVRGDSQLGTPRSPAVRLAKELLYRWVVGRFDGFLVVGRRNREYLEHYGARAARCHSVPHFVDNLRFREQSEATRASRDQLRANLGVTGDEKLVLFVGRFVDFKRPLDLVAALAKLRARGIDAVGVFVGAGPLEQAIRSEAERLGARIHIAGFRNQTELPAFYGAADCLALPSDGNETWGLVVNEAMACGLPVAACERVGSAPDMIIEGQTGSQHQLGNVDDCAAAIHRALGLRHSERLRAQLDEVLARHSCASAVEGTQRAVAAVGPHRGGSR